MTDKLLLVTTLCVAIFSASFPVRAADPPQSKPIPRTSKGGIYLHNQRLDEQAQQVQKMAAEVTNSQVFDAELANLDNMARYSAERIFASARRAAMATLDATFVWSDIKTRVGNWQETLLTVKQDDWTAAQTLLKSKITAAEQEIKARKDALAGAGHVPAILEDLSSASDANDFFTFAHDLAAKKAGDKSDLTTVDVRIAKQLTEAAGRVAGILSELYKLASIPAASDAVREMKAGLLRAELQHIAAEARIQARREAALSDIRHLAKTVENAVSCLQTGKAGGRGCLTSLATGAPIDLITDGAVQDGDEIGNTLNRFVRRTVLARQAADTCLNAQLSGASRDCTAAGRVASDERLKLLFIVDALQNWSALAARVATPSRLASARLAQEEHRYSIQRDAIMARSYENIIGSGAQRLATYYKGGLKPETIAQFVQALSTAGLIPTVALK